MSLRQLRTPQSSPSSDVGQGMPWRASSHARGALGLGCPSWAEADRAAWACGLGLCSSSSPSLGTPLSAPRAHCFSPGPPIFAEHPGLLSPAGVAARSREPGRGIALVRKQSQSWCWMGHLVLGYPACCLSRHGAAALPGLLVAPGSPALPCACPAIPAACLYRS